MLLPLDIFFCDVGLRELETVLLILIGLFCSLYMSLYIFSLEVPVFLFICICLLKQKVKSIQ